MKAGRKIVSPFLNKTLRWKIMFCVIAMSAFLVSSVFLSFFLNIYTHNILGDSYKSNAELNSLSNHLALVENSLETYTTYHTFESIDAYYSSCLKVQDFISTMQMMPSTDKIKQKEYLIYELSISFLYFSGKAVDERRANSSENFYYLKSLECYRILLKEITNLNIMLMERNAGVYMKNKNNVNFITKSSFVFIVVFFSLLVFLLYLLLTEITQPLSEISKVAMRVAERDFDVPFFNRSSNDEIGNICRAFDRMIVSIKDYIQMQQLYADAQLRTFQSQINPHFLFNTLNTGAQLAMMEGADKTCLFIEQTSDFFRYNLQQQNQAATIQEELGLVDNFVYIMKVRFGKRLEFIKNVPDKNFDQLVPSMTLQPIVENCIKHGLLNMTGIVVLDVSEDNEFVTVCVSDNGSGMSQKTIDDVMMKSKSNPFKKSFENLNIQSDTKYSATNEKHTGIGLINVFSRLRLYFHRDDLFEIQSCQNPDGESADKKTGTKFIIRIPKNV